MNFIINAYRFRLDFAQRVAHRIGHPTARDQFIELHHAVFRNFRKPHPHRLHILRHFIALELFGPVFFRLLRRFHGMKIGHNPPRQLFLRGHRVQIAALHLFLQLNDLHAGHIGQQLVVPPHQRVAHRHRLAVHIQRLFGDPDVVPVRLRHLLHAVEPLEQRHGQHHLRRLPVRPLQLAPHQQIKFLVRAAQFDIRLQRHRVIPLRQRIQQLVHRDRLLFLEALVKVLALQHLRHRVLRRQLDHALGAERA